jgi:hypothetical protein
MDSASSLAYPGSRAVAGLFRSLERYQPTALWVGYLWVHRVEALTESAERRPFDGLSLHILEAIATGLQPLAARLHLPAAAVHQLLFALVKQGLVRREPGGTWELTDRGRQVLHERADTTPWRARRAFPFVEHVNSTGRRLGAPRYAPVAECAGAAWEANQNHRLDPDILRSAALEPHAWKQAHGFPLGAVPILPRGDDADSEGWQRIVIDRPQRVAIALIATASHDLLGFAADAADWSPAAESPVLRLAEAGRDALPDLAAPPSAWREAWRLWCRQRRLPLSEADACQLDLAGPHLDVRVPQSLHQRLSPAEIQEPIALLAGSGYLRAAALLRVHG